MTARVGPAKLLARCGNFRGRLVSAPRPYGKHGTANAAAPSRGGTSTNEPARLIADPDPERLGRYVVVVDHGFDIVEATSEYERLLGYKRRGLVGVSAWELDAEPRNGESRGDVVDELASNGEVERANVLRARGGELIPVRARAVPIRGGELYVAVLDLIVPARASIAYAEEWLTVGQAVGYTTLSARTLERLEADGELRRGGTPGRPLYKRKWLDAALGAGPFSLLVALFVLVLASLLIGEVVDVLLPGGDFGFPPGLGHPLSHPVEAGGDLRVALERWLDV